MGIFTEDGDSWDQEIQMQTHGRLDQDDDPAVTCSRTDLTFTSKLEAWNLFYDETNLEINAFRFYLTDDTVIEAGEADLNFGRETVQEFGTVPIDFYSSGPIHLYGFRS